MASYPPADALPPGKMALAQNVRGAWGKPVVRLPLTTIGAPASAAGWCAGGTELVQDGANSIVAAIGYGPGVVDVHGTGFWVSRNGGAAWTQMHVNYPLGPQSPYGQTTFGSEDTRVEFQLVRDRTWGSNTAYDLIVIQDGTNAPLIYGKSNSGTFAGGYGMSVVQGSVPAPLGGTGLQFYTGFNNQWPVTTTADQVYTNSDATQLNAFFSGSPTLILLPAYTNATSTINFGAHYLNLTNQTNGAAGQFILLASAFMSPSVVTGTMPYGIVNYGGTAPTSSVTQAAAGLLAGTTVGANAAGPPVFEVATTGPHGLLNGQTVVIAQATMTNGTKTQPAPCNGTWTVTVIDPTHFVLNGSSGFPSGFNYVSGSAVIDVPVPDFWPQVKIVLTDSGAKTLTLYDPETMFGTPVFLTRTDADTQFGLVQIAYPLPATTNGFNFAQVSEITFSYEGEVPPVQIQSSIFCMAASGRFQGTSAFAAAYFSQDTRQIGPSTAYPAVTPGQTLGNGTTIADDARFWYDYTVNIPAIPPAALNAGVDSGLLYAQLPGQSQPYLCGQILLGEWAGIPTYAWQAVSNVGSGNYASDWTFFAQDLGWPALSGAYLSLPIGAAMCATSQRLLVGGGSTLWISGVERPFQFTALQQLDLVTGQLSPTSPTSVNIDGQTVQALLAIGSLSGGSASAGEPLLGAASVHVFTDRATLTTSGWDAESMARLARVYDFGTYAPWSVAPFQNGWVMLSTDGHVVRYGINPAIPYAGMYAYPISRLIVEDLTRGVPDVRISAVCAGVKDECYYLCLSPAGSTSRQPNTFALVWDYNESVRANDNVWYSDLFPGSVQGVSRFFSYRSGFRTHLLGFDLTGQLLEHVTQGSTADAGSTGVAWSLVFPEVRGDGFMPVLVRRACVHCDANIGQLATSRATQGRMAQVTSAAVLSTTTPGTRCVRYDNVVAGGSQIPGAAGQGVTFTLSGVSPSLSVIHGVSVEVGRLAADGPDVS